MSKNSAKKIARRNAHKQIQDGVVKVKYKHYRLVSDNIHGCPKGVLINPGLITLGQYDPNYDILHAKGGLTVAEVIMKDGTVKFGVAECSPDCNFKKHRGRTTAYFRALSGSKPPKHNSLTELVHLPEFVEDILSK